MIYAIIAIAPQGTEMICAAYPPEAEAVFDMHARRIKYPSWEFYVTSAEREKNREATRKAQGG